MKATARLPEKLSDNVDDSFVVNTDRTDHICMKVEHFLLIMVVSEYSVTFFYESEIRRDKIGEVHILLDRVDEADSKGS